MGLPLPHPDPCRVGARYVRHGDGCDRAGVRGMRGLAALSKKSGAALEAAPLVYVLAGCGSEPDRSGGGMATRTSVPPVSTGPMAIVPPSALARSRIFSRPWPI